MGQKKGKLAVRRRRKTRSNASPRLWRGLREWLRDGRMAGALLVLGCGLILGYFFLSPQFRIQDVEVLGNRVLPREEALKESGIVSGDNLFLIDVLTVKQRLEEIPYVQRARIERVLPNLVRLRIWERFPSVSWAPDNSPQRFLIDDSGLVLGPEQEGMEQLIYIVDKEGGALKPGDYVDVEAVQTAQQVFARLYNDLQVLLLPFEYRSERGITAVSMDGWRACFGNSEHLEEKVRNLAALLQSEVYFEEVDLRLPEQIRYR